MDAKTLFFCSLLATVLISQIAVGQEQEGTCTIPCHPSSSTFFAGPSDVRVKFSTKQYYTIIQVYYYHFVQNFGEALANDCHDQESIDVPCYYDIRNADWIAISENT